MWQSDHEGACVFQAQVDLSQGLPGNKESTCQFRRGRRGRFNPQVGKIPCSRKWQPTSVFLPEKSHGQRSLVCYRPWGRKKSWGTHAILHPLFSLSHLICAKEAGDWSRALERQGSLCFADDNSSAHASSELLHVQIPGRHDSCSAHGSRSNHVPWICGDHIDMMAQGMDEADVHRWRDHQNLEVQDTVEIKSFIPRWCS